MLLEWVKSATRAYVIDLMKAYKFKKKWPEKNTDYPKTIEEFDGVDANDNFISYQKEYLEKLEFLDKAGVDLGGVTPIEGLINLKETFGAFKPALRSK